MYLGLFTSQTPTTVPARTAVLSTQTGVTEVSGGGYGRVAVPGSAWGASTTEGNGRRTALAAPGYAFPESTGAWSAPLNGFFLATTATANSGIAIFYANFDQLASITVNAAGYTVRIPAYWQLDG